ncbi:MAG: hypothetical protein IJT31_05485, partial [Oscillibacter sp.]|nr:hypothetical protein [Oscillibacter sp.]
MANINSLMSSTTASSTSSLYGTRNVLTGLASGMDTEAMIENSVSGYKTRITQLQQEQTRYEWRQDAYRGITDKMYDLTQKYTSFTSRTNLLSNTFFNNSISTTVSGPEGVASKVSATGRSSSDIQLLAAQTATAASYSVAASALGLNVSNTATDNITARATATESVGTLKGTMTINYDGKQIDLTFDESDKIDGTDGNTLADAIRAKLGEATVNTSYGTRKASELINVGTDSNGNITFSENGSRGATPYVSYLDSGMKTALGATDSPLYAGSSNKKYTFAGGNRNFVDSTKTVADYLSSKDISVTVDGTTRTFRLNKDTLENDGIQAALRERINSLGLGITASDSGSKLSFTVGDTSNFSISAADERASQLLGLSSGVSNYLDTKSTIGNLIGSDTFDNTFAQAREDDTTVTERLEEEGAYYRDKTTGNLYEKIGSQYFHISDDQNHSPLYELKINDKSIYVSKGASLESVLTGINNSDMGVRASYSKLSGSLVFTAKDTGVNGDISLDNPLAKKLFSASPLDRTLGEIYNLTDPDASFGIKANSKSIVDGTGAQVQFNANSTLSDVIDAFNNSSTVSTYIKYDADTGKFSYVSRNNMSYDPDTKTFSGTGSWVEFDQLRNPWTMRLTDGNNVDTQISAVSTTDFFASGIDPAMRTPGTDATVRALVNGELTTLTRASNTIDMDGMKVTLNGSFNEDKLVKDEN